MTRSQISGQSRSGGLPRLYPVPRLALFFDVLTDRCILPECASISLLGLRCRIRRSDQSCYAGAWHATAASLLPDSRRRHLKFGFESLQWHTTPERRQELQSCIEANRVRQEVTYLTNRGALNHVEDAADGELVGQCQPAQVLTGLVPCASTSSVSCISSQASTSSRMPGTRQTLKNFRSLFLLSFIDF